LIKTIAHFIPTVDVRLVHEIIVHAPAALVFDVAEHFEMDSIPFVRAMFWLRAKILGARYERERMQKGLVEAMLGLGWVMLTCTPGRELVMGSVTQPWVGEVKFRAVPAESFASFSQPGLVKIAWTLEAEPLGPELTRFRTETRVLPIGEDARKKFQAYWRKFGIGIVMIRWLIAPALKEKSERRYRAEKMTQPPAETR
jgi:hypothetical protein